MTLFKRLFRLKVNDTSDKKRLAVVPERALREGFREKAYREFLDARELAFQNTPQIRQIKLDS